MRILLTLLFTAVFAAAPVTADRYKDVQIEHIVLTEQLFMLTGAGGNMAALTGDNGILLIDAQYVELADKIKAKLSQLSQGKALVTLINTHMHGDHVGGNSALAADINIIAHNNVRTRLQQNDQFPQTGLPKTTFNEQLILHINEQTVRLQYMPPSHTDGDIVVWFEEANVIHMGDLLFADRFPFIDTANGGSVSGYIQNVASLIAQMNEQTRVIPGHGSLTDRQGVERFLDMLQKTLTEVQQYKLQGMTEQQVIDKGLGSEWKSWSWNFITEARWISTLFNADIN
ncbi:MBL fold metallo-hydrolase [Chromatiaceae bacterium AAb-1]|nr:MBL fold metallo-hydrolase [Chromatiaceae bacterium AAb-1]